jgi:hypothetical protein
MRERNRKFTDKTVSIRLFTLTDKDSLFRAKLPDRHIIELMIGNCIVRTFDFDKPQQATDQYENLLSVLS